VQRAALDPDVNARLGRDLGRHFLRDFGNDFVRDWVGDFGRYFVQCFGRDLRRDVERDLIRDFGRYLVRYSGRDLVRYFGRGPRKPFGRDSARDFVRDFAQYFGRDFSREVARRFAVAWGVGAEVAAMDWWEDFALIEASSAFGRASVRVAIAYGKLADDAARELALFQPACRVSLGHEPAPDRLNEGLERYGGDPLWPALARHIARISTRNDRALLEDLAARPEQREGPVSWALRTYVRGDIVMRDGSIVAMDSICD